MTALREGTRVSPIGQRVPNIDWPQKSTGASVYSGDVVLPNMLFARIVRSPIPHGRILSIDTDGARRIPGVVAVVTAADLPDRTYIHHGGPLSDRRVLASDVVRFVGEEIAGVAAETLEAADAAMREVAVRFEVLRAATTMAEAVAPEALPIHPGGNVSLSTHREWGAPDDSRTAAVTASGTFRFGRQTHACMETSSVVARWDPEASVLEVWVTTQSPFMVRKELANVLDLEVEQVIVHEVAVGGGFGGKSKICEYEAVAAALSMRSGRPVRLVLTREEEFTATKSRHNFDITLETSATAEGLLTSRVANLRVDNGAYNHSGPSVMGYAGQVVASLYRVPHVVVDSELIYTNKQPGGQFRGYGAPQVTFALESQTDEIAEMLGIDPIDLRVLNANRQGDVTLVGWKLASARLVECLERARVEIDWDRKRAEGGHGRGVGLAAAIHVTGANIYDGADRSSAAIDVLGDGTVRVRYGAADAGTWQRTLLAQFAAEELGIEVDDVSVLTMESHQTPHELGAWSTRGTYLSGHAVGTVARSVAARLRGHAAQVLGVDESELSLEGGRVVGPEGSVSFVDLVNQFESGSLSITEEITIDVESVNRATGISNLSGAYSFAVQAVEVEVDEVTGRVRVIDAVAVHDSGVAINPIGMESQIIGGMAMGIGLALGEELLYENGQSMTRSYIQYPLPRASDLPDIRPIVLGDPDPNGPYGAKGVGEIVLVPTGAAVANAIAHAIGARVRELPASPDRVRQAIVERDRAEERSFGLVRRPNRWWIEAMRRAYPRGAHRLLHQVGTRWSRPLPLAELRSIERPLDESEAVTALSAPGAHAIAGGTDLIPARRQGVIAPTVLVDLSTVSTLGLISEGAGSTRFGAAVRLSDLRDWAATRSPVLAEAIEQIANPQIREMATVGGNLCQQNRCWYLRNDFDCYKRGGVSCPCYAVEGDHRFYHAIVDGHRCQSVTPSDLSTVLSALGATVTLRGPRGSRVLEVEDLYTGPGETVLREGEFVASVDLPAAATGSGANYEKLNRSSGDFAVVSVATMLAVGADGTVTSARAVLGAVAPTPFRARESEDALVGQRGGTSIDRAAEAWVRHAHPLPGNTWKVDVAVGMLRRSLQSSYRRAVEARAVTTSTLEG
ncbi:MAG: molybdopterin-dependent oxidoreductase [Actinobacteria bacterium]|uniref:Unannotated protein n=1 Tax=freshwater metagenome TaxID=449393 RepID=A0A6J7NLF2_9ZZZZ|nr:molybdopterin-dependent oxidoreductase [Actinomycetota bacterium]